MSPTPLACPSPLQVDLFKTESPQDGGTGEVSTCNPSPDHRPLTWIRRITSRDLHEAYLRSSEFAQFWIFILDLNASSEDKRFSQISPDMVTSEMDSLISALSDLKSWISEFEPLPVQSVRFGNPSFREWHARLVERAPKLLAGVCPPEHVEELAGYLCASFGSVERLDFGTGHELQFAVLLYCLRQCQVFDKRHNAALALRVFPKYLDTTRALQQKYSLEPAGSKGVWGLDDYAFLPFVWGSSQLLGSSKIPPDFVNDIPLINEYRKEYLYVDAIGYIRDYKSGPFHEHSPTLWDITGVRAGWPKINNGMLKMYKAEVLGKLPVAQHILFGELFKFPELKTRKMRPPVLGVAGGPVSNVNLDSEGTDED